MKNKKLIGLIIAILTFTTIVLQGFINYKETGKIDENKVKEAITTIADGIKQYNMSEEEVKELPSTEIIEKTEEDEKKTEQATTEVEGFEEQGEIAYNGTSEYPKVELGNYVGLTYYSQLDSRWSSHLYTSVGNSDQTIGTSGCGPTCASMVVTATKGTITPERMGDLFVEYGYRSANNGTYFSAFRFVADTFNINYAEAYKLDDVVQALRTNHYVIASCGNGLFTTGGHFILLTGIEGDTIKIYDPYLYSGKFETSTRRGKVSVNGNTVYCSVENFRNYANYTKFFVFEHNGEVKQNDVKPVTTSTYTRYVKANGGLNVRNAPNGNRIGGIANRTKVTVYETNGNWSRVEQGWVCSTYLVSTIVNNATVNSKIATTQSSTGNAYRTGNYRVNASVLNVRTGPGKKYRPKKYYELTSNARSQNKRLGDYYTNGYKRGVVCTVTSVKGNWGYTRSGWICLNYCSKI